MNFERYFVFAPGFGSDACRVPGWARNEHLEKIVPLRELWKYAERGETKSSRGKQNRGRA